MKDFAKCLLVLPLNSWQLKQITTRIALPSLGHSSIEWMDRRLFFFFFSERKLALEAVT